MTLIDKEALLAELEEAIKDFKPKDEEDKAFLAGVLTARRIVKFAKEADNG